MKLINLILIVTICFGILFLSFQSDKKFNIYLLKKRDAAGLFNYNKISIKQIDSVTAYSNLKFSKLFTESAKLKPGFFYPKSSD